MHLSASLFLVIVGFVIPMLAWRGKQLLDSGLELPRTAFYVESIVMQTILAGTALGIAAWNGIDLLRPPRPVLTDWLWGTALLAIALALMAFTWSRTDEHRRGRLLQLLPSTERERMIWPWVSLAAGFGEEIVYRGLVFALLGRITGNWWAAAIITSLLFAAAHLVQGWTSSAIVFVFAILLQLLVRETDTLAVAIAVHLLYDLIVGLALGPRSPEPAD